MFERKYLVKIYLEKQAVPLLEFTVLAASVRAEGHTLHADGVVMQYSDSHYITVAEQN
jgi:hypothetical protein